MAPNVQRGLVLRQEILFQVIMLDELLAVQKDHGRSLGMFMNLLWLISMHCVRAKECIIEKLDVTKKMFLGWHAHIL
jgi:hypothetical protein